MRDDASIDAALEQEKGDALFDVRHRFVVSFSAELPGPENMGAVMRPLAGGWQLNGILQTQTGFPFTMIDSVATGIQYLTNRPYLVCDPDENAPHTTDQWFNTSCFERRPIAQTAGLSTLGGRGLGGFPDPGPGTRIPARTRRRCDALAPADDGF